MYDPIQELLSHPTYQNAPPERQAAARNAFLDSEFHQQVSVDPNWASIDPMEQATVATNWAVHYAPQLSDDATWQAQYTEHLMNRTLGYDDSEDNELRTLRTAIDDWKSKGWVKSIPFVGGWSSMRETGALLLASERIKNGKATRKDWDAWLQARNEMLSAQRRDDTTGHKFFSIASHLPAFGLEILLTGGVFRGAAKAGEAGAMKAATGLLRKNLDDVLAGAAAGTSTGVEKMMMGGAKGVGFWTSNMIGQTVAMRPITESLRRMTPGLDLSWDQQRRAWDIIRIKEGEAPLPAIAKGFLDTGIELASETMGGALVAPFGAAASIAKKLTPTAMAQALGYRYAGLKRLAAKVGFDKAAEIATKAGYHGVFAEMLEERAGEIMRGATGLTGEGATAAERIRSSLPDLTTEEGKEQFAAEALAFSVMGIGYNVGGSLAMKALDSKQRMNNEGILEKERTDSLNKWLNSMDHVRERADKDRAAWSMVPAEELAAHAKANKITEFRGVDIDKASPEVLEDLREMMMQQTLDVSKVFSESNVNSIRQKASELTQYEWFDEYRKDHDTVYAPDASWFVPAGREFNALIGAAKRFDSVEAYESTAGDFNVDDEAYIPADVRAYAELMRQHGGLFQIDRIMTGPSAVIVDTPQNIHRATNGRYDLEELSRADKINPDDPAYEPGVDKIKVRIHGSSSFDPDGVGGSIELLGRPNLTTLLEETAEVAFGRIQSDLRYAGLKRLTNSWLRRLRADIVEAGPSGLQHSDGELFAKAFTYTALKHGKGTKNKIDRQISENVVMPPELVNALMEELRAGIPREQLHLVRNMEAIGNSILLNKYAFPQEVSRLDKRVSEMAVPLESLQAQLDELTTALDTTSDETLSEDAGVGNVQDILTGIRNILTDAERFGYSTTKLQKSIDELELASMKPGAAPPLAEVGRILSQASTVLSRQGGRALERSRAALALARSRALGQQTEDTRFVTGGQKVVGPSAGLNTEINSYPLILRPLVRAVLDGKQDVRVLGIEYGGPADSPRPIGIRVRSQVDGETRVILAPRLDAEDYDPDTANAQEAMRVAVTAAMNRMAPTAILNNATRKSLVQRLDQYLQTLPPQFNAALESAHRSANRVEFGRLVSLALDHAVAMHQWRRQDAKAFDQNPAAFVQDRKREVDSEGPAGTGIGFSMSLEPADWQRRAVVGYEAFEDPGLETRPANLAATTGLIDASIWNPPELYQSGAIVTEELIVERMRDAQENGWFEDGTVDRLHRAVKAGYTIEGVTPAGELLVRDNNGKSLLVPKQTGAGLIGNRGFNLQILGEDLSSETSVGVVAPEGGGWVGTLRPPNGRAVLYRVHLPIQSFVRPGNRVSDDHSTAVIIRFGDYVGDGSYQNELSLEQGSVVVLPVPSDQIQDYLADPLNARTTLNQAYLAMKEQFDIEQSDLRKIEIREEYDRMISVANDYSLSEAERSEVSAALADPRYDDARKAYVEDNFQLMQLQRRQAAENEFQRSMSRNNEDRAERWQEMDDQDVGSAEERPGHKGIYFNVPKIPVENQIMSRMIETADRPSVTMFVSSSSLDAGIYAIGTVETGYKAIRLDVQTTPSKQPARLRVGQVEIANSKDVPGKTHAAKVQYLMGYTDAEVAANEMLSEWFAGKSQAYVSTIAETLGQAAQVYDLTTANFGRVIRPDSKQLLEPRGYKRLHIQKYYDRALAAAEVMAGKSTLEDDSAPADEKASRTVSQLDTPAQPAAPGKVQLTVPWQVRVQHISPRVKVYRAMMTMGEMGYQDADPNFRPFEDVHLVHSWRTGIWSLYVAGDMVHLKSDKQKSMEQQASALRKKYGEQGTMDPATQQRMMAEFATEEKALYRESALSEREAKQRASAILMQTAQGEAGGMFLDVYRRRATANNEKPLTRLLSENFRSIEAMNSDREITWDWRNELNQYEKQGSYIDDIRRAAGEIWYPVKAGYRTLAEVYYVEEAYEGYELVRYLSRFMTKNGNWKTGTRPEIPKALAPSGRMKKLTPQALMQELNTRAENIKDLRRAMRSQQEEINKIQRTKGPNAPELNALREEYRELRKQQVKNRGDYRRYVVSFGKRVEISRDQLGSMVSGLVIGQYKSVANAITMDKTFDFLQEGEYYENPDTGQKWQSVAVPYYEDTLNELLEQADTNDVVLRKEASGDIRPSDLLEQTSTAHLNSVREGRRISKGVSQPIFTAVEWITSDRASTLPITDQTVATIDADEAVSRPVAELITNPLQGVYWYGQDQDKLVSDGIPRKWDPTLRPSPAPDTPISALFVFRSNEKPWRSENAEQFGQHYQGDPSDLEALAKQVESDGPAILAAIETASAEGEDVVELMDAFQQVNQRAILLREAADTARWHQKYLTAPYKWPVLEGAQDSPAKAKANFVSRFVEAQVIADRAENLVRRSAREMRLRADARDADGTVIIEDTLYDRVQDITKQYTMADRSNLEESARYDEPAWGNLHGTITTEDVGNQWRPTLVLRGPTAMEMGLKLRKFMRTGMSDEQWGKQYGYNERMAMSLDLAIRRGSSRAFGSINLVPHEVGQEVSEADGELYKAAVNQIVDIATAQQVPQVDVDHWAKWMKRATELKAEGLEDTYQEWNRLVKRAEALKADQDEFVPANQRQIKQVVERDRHREAAERQAYRNLLVDRWRKVQDTLVGPVWRNQAPTAAELEVWSHLLEQRVSTLGKPQYEREKTRHMREAADRVRAMGLSEPADISPELEALLPKRPVDKGFSLSIEDLNEQSGWASMVQASGFVRDLETFMVNNGVMLVEDNARGMETLMYLGGKYLTRANSNPQEFVRRSSNILSHLWFRELMPNELPTNGKIDHLRTVISATMTKRIYDEADNSLAARARRMIDKLIAYLRSWFDGHVEAIEAMFDTIVATGGATNVGIQRRAEQTPMVPSLGAYHEMLRELIGSWENVGLRPTLTGSIAYVAQGVNIYRDQPLGGSMMDVDFQLSGDQAARRAWYMLSKMHPNATVWYSFAPKDADETDTKYVIGALVPRYSWVKLTDVFSRGYRKETNPDVRYERGFTQKIPGRPNVVYHYVKDHNGKVTETWNGQSEPVMAMELPLVVDMIDAPVQVQHRIESTVPFQDAQGNASPDTFQVTPYPVGFTAKMQQLRLKDLVDYELLDAMNLRTDRDISEEEWKTLMRELTTRTQAYIAGPTPEFQDPIYRTQRVRLLIDRFMESHGVRFDPEDMYRMNRVFVSKVGAYNKGAVNTLSAGQDLKLLEESTKRMLSGLNHGGLQLSAASWEPGTRPPLNEGLYWVVRPRSENVLFASSVDVFSTIGKQLAQGAAKLPQGMLTDLAPSIKKALTDRINWEKLAGPNVVAVTTTDEYGLRIVASEAAMVYIKADGTVENVRRSSPIYKVSRLINQWAEDDVSGMFRHGVTARDKYTNPHETRPLRSDIIYNPKGKKRGYSLEILSAPGRNAPWAGDQAANAYNGIQEIRAGTNKINRKRTYELLRIQQLSSLLRRKYSPAVREAMTFYLEGTGNLSGTMGKDDIVKFLAQHNAMEDAENVRKALERVRGELNKELVNLDESEFVRFLNHFMPHFYEQKSLQAEYGPYLERMGQRHLQTRKIMTYVEAADIGLVPQSLDVTDTILQYTEATWRWTTRRAVVDILTKSTIGDGRTATAVHADKYNPEKPMMAPGAPKGLRALFKPLRTVEDAYTVGDEKLRPYVAITTGVAKGNRLYVHPDVADLAEKVLDETKASAFWSAIATFNAYAKKVQLSISLFHHWALLESAVALNGLDAFRKLNLPPELEARFTEGKSRPRGFDVGIWLMENDMALEDAMMHGLMLGTPTTIMRNTVTDGIAGVRKKFGNVPIVGPALKAIEKGNERWDAFLWDRMFNGYKMLSYYSLVEKYLGTGQYVGREREIKEAVAEMVNAGMGGINWDEKWWASNSVQRMMRAILLAPDWTTANVEITPFPRLLRLDTAMSKLFGHIRTDEEVNAAILGNKLRIKEYWPRMLLTMALAPLAVQAAIYAMFHGDDPELTPVNWMNEKGHASVVFSDVDVTPIVRRLDQLVAPMARVPGLGLLMNPFYHETDQPRNAQTRWYLHGGKQVREVFTGWMRNPLGTLARKMSPFMQATMEVHSIATDQSQAYKSPLFSSEMAVQIGKSLVTKFIPFSARGNQFAFTLPLSKGMTEWKFQQYAEGTLAAYADPGLLNGWGKKDYLTDLGLLVPDLIEAGISNGVDTEAKLRDARSVVRGKYYRDFFDAYVGGNEIEMEEAARALLRLHVGITDFDTSMRNQFKRNRMVYTDTDADEAAWLLRNVADRMGVGGDHEFYQSLMRRQISRNQRRR